MMHEYSVDDREERGLEQKVRKKGKQEYSRERLRIIVEKEAFPILVIK